jgi:hypothetical protein
MTTNTSFRSQVQRNAVALISLVIAVTSLGYNTWRNERTEYNRNQRQASMEVLLKLGELQQVVFHRHYDRDVADKGNPRMGWALVLTIRDLSQVLDSPLPEAAAGLVEVWGRHWDELGASQAGADAILKSIESVRDDTLALLRSLD